MRARVAHCMSVRSSQSSENTRVFVTLLLAHLTRFLASCHRAGIRQLSLRSLAQCASQTPGARSLAIPLQQGRESLCGSTPELLPNGCRRLRTTRGSQTASRPVDEEGNHKQDQTSGNQSGNALSVSLRELVSNIGSDSLMLTRHEQVPGVGAARREDHQNGHRLTQSAAQAQKASGNHAVTGERHDGDTHHLPASSTEGESAFNLRARNLRQNVASHRRDNRQDHDCQNDAHGGDSARRVRLWGGEKRDPT